MEAMGGLASRFVDATQASLIVALVVIAVVHTRTRIGGALLTAGWCLAATHYGWQQFQGRDTGLAFAGMSTPQWVFYGAMVGVFAYNVVVAVRGLTRKVASRMPMRSPSSPSPTSPPSTPPAP
jgi:hypothetical protein